MSDEVLKEVFRQVKEMYHLSLTGGEPFLAPQVIENMVDIIIDRKIRIHRCTTVDNGTILNDLGIRSVKALNRLGEYIYNSVWSDEERNNPEENLPISISISNSTYHKNDVQKAIDFYKLYANEYVNIDDQGNWEIGLKDKQGNPLKNKDIKSDSIWLKKEGRAKENNLNAKYTTDTYRVEFWISDDENKAAVTTGIQICANGNVVITEPLSFDTMDKKNMGNILKEPLSCMIHKWNWIEPLRKQEVTVYCNNKKVLENPKISSDRKAQLSLINKYIDLKKLLYVEGHKEYPYWSKNELAFAVSLKLASIIYDELKKVNYETTLKEVTKEIFKSEDIDVGGEINMFLLNLDLRFNILKHNERLKAERGYFGYLLLMLNLIFFRNDKYYRKLAEEVSAYEK